MTSTQPSGTTGDNGSSWRDDQRFRKAERLSKRPEFLNARRNGWRQEGRRVVIYVVANDLGHCRLGVTVSRRVGNAVVRNRWKRRLREIFRRNKHQFGDSYDVVIIAKPGGDISFHQIKDDVIRTVRRAVKSYRNRRENR